MAITELVRRAREGARDAYDTHPNGDWLDPIVILSVFLDQPSSPLSLIRETSPPPVQLTMHDVALVAMLGRR